MGDVISLKKYIDGHQQELLESVIACFRSALETMGNNGHRACPPVGGELRESLSSLSRRLSDDATPETIREVGHEVEAHLDRWGTRAAGYLKDRAGEFKELTLILANTAELVGARDQRYVQQVHSFTERLQSIADLQDLKQIRDSLYQSAIELKSCAREMARESQESLTRLRQEVEQYQSRLEDAEQLAGRDPLTGLDNRRKAESLLDFRIAQKQAFSVILLDLNEFKQINDTYGHAVGDEVLKQFACELKAAFRSTDMVARWGGDEFMVILDSETGDPKTHVERLSQWVFGQYTIRTTGRPLVLQVSGAVGVASWQPGETAAALVARADALMYRDKSGARRLAKSGDREICSKIGK